MLATTKCRRIEVVDCKRDRNEDNNLLISEACKTRLTNLAFKTKLGNRFVVAMGSELKQSGCTLSMLLDRMRRELDSYTRMKQTEWNDIYQEFNLIRKSTSVGAHIQEIEYFLDVFKCFLKDVI